MKKEVTIKAKDGGKFNALVTYPATDLPAPAIVVIQEIFGINKFMKSVCEHLSQAGYITICPDLFWRLEPGLDLDDRDEKDRKKAFKLFEKFDVELGVEDLKSTLAHVRKDPECIGKAGTMGYCLGGKLAYLMATRSDADCNISYYGVGIENLLDEAKKIKKPYLMHIAQDDKFVSLDAQADIIDTLNHVKNAEIHVYPEVDHAFARIGGENYDKAAARQANYNTADFLALCLARKVK